MMVVSDLELWKETRARQQQFHEDMVDVLARTRNVVDKDTYAILSRAYAVSGNAAYAMGHLIRRVEELEAQLSNL